MTSSTPLLVCEKQVSRNNQEARLLVLDPACRMSGNICYPWHVALNGTCGLFKARPRFIRKQPSAMAETGGLSTVGVGVGISTDGGTLQTDASVTIRPHLRAARWSEFANLEGNEPLWRIPAERMKMKREHIVPLAPQAVAVLRELRALPGSGASPFLFPSPSREGYMSNNTMLYALYRIGYHGRATVHGFRSMASTALNEMGFRTDVIERQLAHQEQNAVRAAYNRAEYLNERRAMMKRWADHLDAIAGENIVPYKPKIGMES